MATRTLYETQPAPSYGAGQSLQNPLDVPLLIEDPAWKAALSSYPGITKNWFTPGHLQAEYIYYMIHTRYETDEGLVCSPSTAPPEGLPVAFNSQGENVFSRISGPCTKKIVTWSAARLYVKPLLPHWKNGNSNEKLLYKTIALTPPKQSVNHRVWQVDGVYIYGFKKEPYAVVGSVDRFILPAHVPACENTPPAANAYDQGDFSFVPLDTRWVPVEPRSTGELPMGYAGRVSSPDAGPNGTAQNDRVQAGGN